MKEVTLIHKAEITQIVKLQGGYYGELKSADEIAKIFEDQLKARGMDDAHVTTKVFVN